MPGIKTYFVQSCPVCGRSLHVSVQLLGQVVACQHCQGNFVACDRDRGFAPAIDPRADLMQRVDRLLANHSGVGCSEIHFSGSQIPGIG